MREYFIPDFSNWKDYDAYRRALQRLLRDLKAVPESDDFTVTFAPGLSSDQVRKALDALATYYRICGGVGLQSDFELSDVLVEEPSDVLV